jgi:site-specific DNA-cytosine methylase
MLTHVDLFTGLGGFSLAARAAGFVTVAMCEFDPFRRAGLARAWPGVPIIEDVREFHWPLADAEPNGHQGSKHEKRRQGEGCNRRRLADLPFEGHPTLLTAGVPCQPASRAGKQRGAGDDRWLWGEAVRVIAEAKPSWALLENPPGIEDLAQYGDDAPVDAAGNPSGNLGDVYHRAGPGVLQTLLGEIEAMGYEVGILEVPACAVDSPQLRRRLWIVACSNEARCCKGGIAAASAGHRDSTEPTSGSGHVADTEEIGCGWRTCASRRLRSRTSSQDGGLCSPWSDYQRLPCADGKLRRAPADPLGMAHGLPKGVPRKLLAALGDSIVWPVAYEILRAIRMEIEAA